MDRDHSVHSHQTLCSVHESTSREKQIKFNAKNNKVSHLKWTIRAIKDPGGASFGIQVALLMRNPAKIIRKAKGKWPLTTAIFK